MIIYVINKAENYMPRFPTSSGALCSLASLLTSVQHCLEMLVHYLVTLSYKPVQQSQTHNRWLHCIFIGITNQRSLGYKVCPRDFLYPIYCFLFSLHFLFLGLYICSSFKLNICFPKIFKSSKTNILADLSLGRTKCAIHVSSHRKSFIL